MKNNAVLFILFVAVLVSWQRREARQVQPVIHHDKVPVFDLKLDPPRFQKDPLPSGYWKAFHEGIELEFREDRGSRGWWSAWEKNFDQRMDTSLRR